VRILNPTNLIKSVGFKVPTAIVMKNSLFCDITPERIARRYIPDDITLHIEENRRKGSTFNSIAP
jgi:hypothetical protein